MAGFKNIQPDKVLKAFQKAGWIFNTQESSHIINVSGLDI